VVEHRKKRARNDDEEAAYESYMNPEPGFQSVPGDSLEAVKKLHEPRARLPLRPGGLCKRRLDGTLSVSY